MCGILQNKDHPSPHALCKIVHIGLLPLLLLHLNLLTFKFKHVKLLTRCKSGLFKQVWQPVLERKTYVNMRKWKASYMHAICARSKTDSHTCMKAVSLADCSLISTIKLSALDTPLGKFYICPPKVAT